MTAFFGEGGGEVLFLAKMQAPSRAESELLLAFNRICDRLCKMYYAHPSDREILSQLRDKEKIIL